MHRQRGCCRLPQTTGVRCLAPPDPEGSSAPLCRQKPHSAAEAILLVFVRRLVGAEAVDTLGNIGRRSQNAERFAEPGAGRKCLTAGALDYSRFPSPTYG